MKKIKVGIIGTGNIGTDLLIKIQRSDVLQCSIFMGRNPDSIGIRKAESMGVRTSLDSIDAIVKDPSCCEIVFDATSAKAHFYNAPILKKLGKYTIDLTPSQVGKMCVPAINMSECLDVDNVNLVTCGGQAVIPLVDAIMRVHPDTSYVEVVASISSKSAGAGTRANIDEFTQTTKDAIISLANAPKAKAIIVLNPAEPPMLMHNTIYAKIDRPDIDRLRDEILSAAEKIQDYVPGYKVTLGPAAERGRVTTMIEVVGLGDYLPKYSGNLDIITCAAVRVAEEYAGNRILKMGIRR
ncbi:MAG: acetaldehyde dehydrogenase (acetylating) [Phycisphaerae bacterium]|nr:acetaldehyde dehydrogenase (acetylating) [Phycisphaerae bacterium]